VKKNDVGVGRNLAEDVSKENEQEKNDNKEGGRSKLWRYIVYYESPVTSRRTVAMEGTK
jgi:hypothetical protein